MANPKAQAAKEKASKGNVAFKSGDYPNAIGHYTSAMLADRSDPTFPLNRAAAYLKLGKNEDAERDCTTVLGINPSNTKALFRRGQARIATGKLVEAQRDLNEALRLELGNESVKEELKKVADLIEKEKLKKSKTEPISAVKSSLFPEAAPKRRRIPIKIVEASGSSSSPTASKPKSPTPSPVPKPAPTANQPSPTTRWTADVDTLKPVSSRSLKKSPSIPPTSSDVASSTSTPPTSAELSSKPTSPPPKAANFKDAKQSRDSTKPSRVGGGIFRSSGNNTIFPTRDGSSNSPPTDIPAPAAAATANKSARGAPPQPSVSKTPVQAPTTLFEFTQAWGRSVSVHDRWDLISSIAPSAIPTLFKSSLEPEMLASILETFLSMLKAEGSNSAIVQSVRDYMDNLARVPRFVTLVLFLSKTEKELAKEVWMALGIENPTGPWDSLRRSK